MKRLVTLLVLSAISTSLPSAKAQTGGPQPQGPYPNAAPYQQYGPIGQRPLTPSSGPPLQANGAFVYQQPTCATGNCGGQKSCLQKLKDWVCYCPTAGDALPKLQFHPFMGPWAGTFYCTPGSCDGGCGAHNKGTGSCKPCDSGACNGSSKKCAAPCGGPCSAQSAESAGYPMRGCQGGSVAPMGAAPIQVFPATNEARDLPNLPRSVGSNLDVRETVPELPAGTGTLEIPVAPSGPQSKGVTPVVPSVVPASAVAGVPAAKKPAGEPEVVQVEFRAVGSKPFVQTADATTEPVGAPMNVKPIKSPLDLFVRP